MFVKIMSDKQNGFSLVEIIVTIIVVGILTTIGATSFIKTQVSSRDSQRMAKASIIAEALEKYYQTNGSYPDCSDLTKDPSTVSSTTLKGLNPSSLAAPTAANGVNSISCSDANVNSFLYEPTNNLQYNLTYVKELTGELVQIKSRYSLKQLANITLTISGTTSTQTSISWTSIEGAAKYELQRSTSADFSANLIKQTYTNTSTTNSDLSPGTTYYYKVLASALNANGN